MFGGTASVAFGWVRLAVVLCLNNDCVMKICGGVEV